MNAGKAGCRIKKDQMYGAGGLVEAGAEANSFYADTALKGSAIIHALWKAKT